MLIILKKRFDARGPKATERFGNIFALEYTLMRELQVRSFTQGLQPEVVFARGKVAR